MRPLVIPDIDETEVGFEVAKKMIVDQLICNKYNETLCDLNCRGRWFWENYTRKRGLQDVPNDWQLNFQI